MAITTSRLTPALGAIVDGVRLADELPQDTIGRLGELLVEHQILFFRGQPITPQQQVPLRRALRRAAHTSDLSAAAGIAADPGARHARRFSSRQ
jgi:alpha-ketoglutarate-dependent taurine dioxygenase